MNRPKAATRRAALAAFLLFAAALLVVSPAEASRTTPDARPYLSSASSEALAPSSLELTTLELVEPIDPVESSPRFGFGEDLGLLDPEAGPGGFVVFAVEAAQCELTYARNNPLKYVDPDGRKETLAQRLSQAMQPVVQVSRLLAEIAAPFDTHGNIRGAAAMIDLTARTLNLGTGTGDAIGSGGDAFAVTMAAAGDVRTLSEATLVIATAGKVTQGAMAPTPFGPGSVGAAEVRTLQSGGHTISGSTAKGLNEAAGTNLTRRDWGRALEALKKENGIPNNEHPLIRATGDVVKKDGTFIANVIDYLK